MGGRDLREAMGGKTYPYGDLADLLSQVAERRLPYKKHGYADLLQGEAPISPRHGRVLNKRLRDAALRPLHISESNCRDIAESIGRERGKLVYAASAMLGLLGECDNEVAGRNRCDNGEGGGR